MTLASGGHSDRRPRLHATSASPGGAVARFPVLPCRGVICSLVPKGLSLINVRTSDFRYFVSTEEAAPG